MMRLKLKGQEDRIAEASYDGTADYYDINPASGKEGIPKGKGKMISRQSQ